MRSLIFSAILVAVPMVALAESGTWAFKPGDDAFTDDALLDLRYLNEDESGQNGFVRLSEDGDDFVLGDGTPARFWAIGTGLYSKSAEEMEEHCRFLAKIGVNMARLHTTVCNKKEGSKITDVNQKTIDGIFRFLAAAKKNGIYVTISPFYGHFNTPESWELEGYTGKYPWGALFIEERMQDAYKVWTKKLYTTVNPHTGLAIKDDPTVAIIQVHNEDSLLFWTNSRIPDVSMRKLERAYSDFLTEKYGSLAAASKAWDGHKWKRDDLDNGILGLLDIYQMTMDVSGRLEKRLRDQTEFYTTYQRDFYARMGSYLRDDLGCKQLLNATNWQTANNLKMKALERYTYDALDVDAENIYVGRGYAHKAPDGTHGYRINKGDFIVSESTLYKPLDLSTTLKQTVGHPTMLTETSWKHPNLYQSEGPFLVAAHTSLTGFDAAFWFSAGAARYEKDMARRFWTINGEHPILKWTFSTPMHAGMLPANSLLFREGYVEQSDVLVKEVRSVESMYRREPAPLDDREIDGVTDESNLLTSTKTPDGRISPVALLVGRCVSEIAAEEDDLIVEDFSDRLDAEEQTITSTTDELKWDYGDGIFTLDAPAAQGVTGFLKKAGGRFELSDVTIDSTNDYATVQLVSMDGMSLADSEKILVQVGTTARRTGWSTKPTTEAFGRNKEEVEGEEITSLGEDPYQIANTQVTLILKNSNISKAMLLDVNGYPAKEVGIASDKAGIVHVTLPEDTMYLVLSK
ncbi:hypothetical protein [Stratiformator vulcanicus]|uniref:Glycoside hydrolase family 42 N-terminal domain-containing protein n=1 Tax=Stratiformator vulcanicus TaxID=2527980 RepID=A0A517QXA3_9PLAN|nr:hypothetical protein [Stratiformator vulcanicus]QDT36285.1 hypothetical protein Pan189_06410 [Stratiformator vulcanicus]